MSNWTFHYDTFPLENKNFRITDEGYLQFVAPIAKVGNLTYFDSDTNEIYTEYVSAECLKDSADSFKVKAITVPGHPPTKLTSANTSQYIKGSLGSKWVFDDTFLWMGGTIYDEKAIELIVNGESSEISAGYDSLVRITKQDAGIKREQVKRVGNHISGVPKGRCGKDVRFKLDGIDSVYTWNYSKDSDLVIPDAPEILIDPSNPKKKIIDLHVSKKDQIEVIDSIKEENKMAVITCSDHVFQVDGADAEKLKTFLDLQSSKNTELKNRADSLEVDKTSLQGKLDAANEEIASLKSKLEVLETKQDSSQSIDAEIKLRMDCWDTILPALKELKPDFKIDASMTVPEIKRGFLKIKYPNLATRLDSIQTTPEGISYLDGMFETAVQSIAAENNQKTSTNNIQKTDTRTVFDSISDNGLHIFEEEVSKYNQDSVREARQKLTDLIENPHKK